MSDTATVLTELAQKLRDFGAGPLAQLLVRNVQLEQRIAELEGADVAESAAADDAVSAFNEMASPVTAAEDVPVDIPPVEVPSAEVPSAEAPATPTDATDEDPAAAPPVSDAESGDQPS